MKNKIANAIAYTVGVVAAVAGADVDASDADAPGGVPGTEWSAIDDVAMPGCDRVRWRRGTQSPNAPLGRDAGGRGQGCFAFVLQELAGDANEMRIPAHPADRVSTTAAVVAAPPSRASAVAVKIPDAGLRDAIAAALAKQPGDAITDEDMATLTTLSATDRGIVDLTGLRHATNLRNLDLDRNAILDVSELGELSALTDLSLAGNAVADARPLARLGGLRSLSLASNGLSSVEALAGMRNLRALDLSGNELVDIWPLNLLRRLRDLGLDDNRIGYLHPLRDLQELRTLTLDGNRVENVAPLAALAGLRTLTLADNQIDNIWYLSGLADVERLSLRGNLIENIEPLSGLTELAQLWLGSNQVLDISPLAGLDSLALLDLGGNRIVDVGPLAGLTGLIGLGLGDNDIGDAAALSGLVGLTALDLGGNELAEVPSLVGLDQLKTLWLDANAVSDIAGLAGLAGLTTLVLADNDIVELGSLAGLIALTTLDLWNNEIADIGPLAGLDNLQWLRLAGNQLSDLSPLSNLTRLARLSLGRNEITDIAALSGLESLQRLWLYNNRIADLSPLAEITSLEWLLLTNNAVTQVTPLEGLAQLRYLSLGDNDIRDVSPLAGLGKLNSLYLNRNGLVDISPLSGLRDLRFLDMIDNDIAEIGDVGRLKNLWVLNVEKNALTDIGPLVDNPGLGAGDIVNLRLNPLGAKAVEDIAVLRGRGVDVWFDETTREEFEGSTPTGWTTVALSDDGSVWGVPEKHTSDSASGTVAYMLLGTERGCTFVNAEADRSSRVHVKTEELGRLSDFESATVCRTTSRSYGSFSGLRMAHVRFFDATSPTNIREYVYDASGDSYEERIPTLRSPDLIVEAPSVDNANPAPGTAIELNVAVRNGGRAEAPTTTIRWYRSADSMIANDDTEVGTGAVGALPTGNESAETISLTAPSEQGAHYYGACVDSVPEEWDTGNNCSGGVRIDVADDGDGTGDDHGDTFASATLIAIPSTTEGELDAGDKDYFRVEVAAAGTLRIETTGSTDTYGTLFDSDEASLETDDDDGPGLNFMIERSVAAGSYYVEVRGFGSSTTGAYELNASLAVDVYGGLAVHLRSCTDIPVGIALDHGSEQAALVAAAGACEEDGGSESSCEQGASTFARCGAITYGESGDQCIVTRYSIDVSTRSAAETRALDACRSAGRTGCRIVTNDAGDRMSGCNSEAVQSPDLVVESPAVNDATPAPGSSITFSTTIRNRGDAASDATTLRYYRSSDSSISSGDTAVGTDAVAALAAGANGGASISLTVPSSAGTYYYGACVDSVSGESNTGNNCSTGVRVDVGGGGGTAPDLVVVSPTVDDDTPDAGGAITLSATVRNRGTGASNATILRYYRSSNSTISTSDTEVGTDSVVGLAVDATSAESISLTAPSDPGTYYYGACVDSVSDESSTANNCSDGVEVEVSDGGSDSYCRDDDMIERGERCDVYSTDAYFEVDSAGRGCTRNVPNISDLCVAANIRISGGNVRIYADRSGNGYTIVDVEPEPD